MIDWGLATRLATFVAAGDGFDAAPPRLAALVSESDGRIAGYTGLALAEPLPAPEALSRAAWCERTLRAFGPMLDPVVERLESSAGPLGGPLRAAAEGLFGAELGLVTGYMAQRVLGQYEVAVLEPEAPTGILFLPENLRRAAGALRADPEELLTWIVLHEVTHAYEFGAVPWLRPHLASLWRALIDTFDAKLDPRALLRLPAPDEVRDWLAAVQRDGVVALVATRDQRRQLDRLQAVMALLEGYSEHVMDAVGAELLPSLPELRAALDRRRRSRGAPERLLERLLGLDLKLRQYEEGKRFCDAVVARAGIAGLNRAWVGAEALPELRELRDPDAWMARTGVRGSA